MCCPKQLLKQSGQELLNFRNIDLKKNHIRETMNLQTDKKSEEERNMFHVSCVMCHVSHVTCHLTITLCSFSCYESPQMFGDVAARGFVIDEKKRKTFILPICFFLHLVI